MSLAAQLSPVLCPCYLCGSVILFLKSLHCFAAVLSPLHFFAAVPSLCISSRRSQLNPLQDL